MAEQLAMQVLISVLKGDQNYHYENVAFLCDKDGGIISLAPMIDHEFSTYFMFPDDISRHVYWLMELSKSIRGWEVRPGEYDNFKDPEERKLMEKSATCIHKNLLYIKEHYPQTTEEFLDKAEKLKTALTEASEDFLIRGNTEYPDCADSSAWLIGKARYKDKDEEKASAYEAELYGKGKKLDFRDVSISAINEIKAGFQVKPYSFFKSLRTRSRSSLEKIWNASYTYKNIIFFAYVNDDKVRFVVKKKGGGIKPVLPEDFVKIFELTEDKVRAYYISIFKEMYN